MGRKHFVQQQTSGADSPHDLGKDDMSVHVRSNLKATRLGVALLVLAVAGVFVVNGEARPTKSAASEPTVYMVGSVTNNTFWSAVQRGFLQGGKDFGLHAIYSAPGVHSSASSIPLIQSAIAAKPAGIAINYTDKSLYKVTTQALSGRYPRRSLQQQPLRGSRRQGKHRDDRPEGDEPRLRG